MTDDEKFKAWKLRVKRELKLVGFGKGWIQAVDWEAWRDDYYTFGLTPSEAVETEMDGCLDFWISRLPTP